MAEIGVAASLIQIAGTAIQLTRTLYEFGSTTSAAREQVDYIGKNVSYYSDVLELLVEQFEHDRPIHSRKAIALAEKLYDHSYDLFERIRDLIPGGHRTRDQISFLQRIAWNFKKTRVALLVGELENLKSTVTLLVQVLCAARQIQAYDEDKRSPKEKTKSRDAARRQYLRAENVLVEWQRTQESLPLLQEAVERDDLYSIKAASGSNNEIGPLTSKRSYALVKSQRGTLAVIEAAAASADGSESDKRALVLRNTAEWLEMLIDDWTVLSLERLDDLSDARTAWRATPSSVERGIARKSRSSDRGRPEASEAHRKRVVRDSKSGIAQGVPVEWEAEVPRRGSQISGPDTYNQGSKEPIRPSTKRASRSVRIYPEESATRSRESGRSKEVRPDGGDTDRTKADSRRSQYVEDDNGGEYEADLPFVNSTLRPRRERGSEGEVHGDPFSASAPGPQERGHERELDQTQQRERELNSFGSSARIQAVQNPAIEILPNKDENFNWHNPASRPGQQTSIPEYSDFVPTPKSEVMPWGLGGPQRNNQGKFECTKQNCAVKGSRGFSSKEAMDGHLRRHDPTRPPFSCFDPTIHTIDLDTLLETTARSSVLHGGTGLR